MFPAHRFSRLAFFFQCFSAFAYSSCPKLVLHFLEGGHGRASPSRVTLAIYLCTRGEALNNHGGCRHSLETIWIVHVLLIDPPAREIAALLLHTRTPPPPAPPSPSPPRLTPVVLRVITCVRCRVVVIFAVDCSYLSPVIVVFRCFSCDRYAKAYRETYYAGATSDWWAALIGNENATPMPVHSVFYSLRTMFAES